ncbi:serine/threonine protein kinase [Crateriforma spongiae]|uniref:serine/threonine protein kinase n=1 Tax=Crateriforma spongiae TaxID=2724528 RepID=UPI0039B0AB31
MSGPKTSSSYASDVSQSKQSVLGSRASRIKNVATSALSNLVFTRRRLWTWPLIAAVILFLVGWFTHRHVERQVEHTLAQQLQALLNADVAALKIWLDVREADAESLGHDERVLNLVSGLMQVADDATAQQRTAALLSATEQRTLSDLLDDWLETQNIQGYMVVDRTGLVLASDIEGAVGNTELLQKFLPQFEPIFAGETHYLPPMKSILAMPDVDGEIRAGVPVMFINAPVQQDDGEILAALCLRIRPEDEFSKILQVARSGRTGETYAFNRDGLMVTASRFDETLKEIGLLEDSPHVRSLLNIQLRDPGVDMTTGNRPKLRRNEQPLTALAQSATAGESGLNVGGYRDYRGVRVIGAWTWLDEFDIGVGTEFDTSEAFQSLQSLRIAFLGLTALLVLVTAGLFGLTLYASKLERQGREAVVEARRLGQYSLDEKLGAGAMGEVYRAHHQMLHRPTAVKLLNVDRHDEQAIARFEREVQMTCRLTHPNTIAIFDYGRTPEGVFYYAMEYLDGLSLDDLIRRFGPQPAGRVIYLLRQLCGSLAEAHEQKLIHRDVKPANVMLTRCGGMADFVKLLDFGLVKPQDSDREMTQAGSLTGTPLYMSPEAIQHQPLDHRSDLYAVGAVGYYMLTGTNVFRGQSIVELCQQHVRESPESPSQRMGRPVDAGLERALMWCLEKSPDDRPKDADALDQALAQCVDASRWDKYAAKEWWHRFIDQTTDVDATIEQTVAVGPNFSPPTS